MVVALAESARSQAVLGDRGHAALLITCAVIAGVSSGVSWVLYRTDRDWMGVGGLFSEWPAQWHAI